MSESRTVEATCCMCGAPAKHEVDEVWFDFGEPIIRFGSSKDYHGPSPFMCDEHKADAANALASAVLWERHQSGATGPLWPTRWWVRYADGQVIGGDVVSRS